MTDETENLLKGMVNATEEYNTNKKAIGVSNNNLMPDLAGEVPLSKKGAFTDQSQKPEEIIIEKKEPVTSGIFTSELNNQQNQEANTTILENPVSVEKTENLGSLSEEKNVETSQSLDLKNLDDGLNKVPPLDLQMPQLPNEIVANEPEGITKDLFDKEDTPDNLAPLESNGVSENINSVQPPQIGESSEISIIMNKIEEAEQRTLSRVKESFDMLKKEVSEMIQKKEGSIQNNASLQTAVDTPSPLNEQIISQPSSVNVPQKEMSQIPEIPTLTL